jgi:hypothetical protein
MKLSPIEMLLLGIVSHRLSELREVVVQKQRKEMTGKEALIYDTLKLNEYIQKKLIDKQSGLIQYY